MTDTNPESESDETVDPTPTPRFDEPDPAEEMVLPEGPQRLQEDTPEGNISNPDDPNAPGGGWHVAPPTDDVRAEGDVAGSETQSESSSPEQ